MRPPRHTRVGVPAETAAENSTLPMGSWTTSSMDLLDGVQVVELDGPEPGEPRPH